MMNFVRSLTLAGEIFLTSAFMALGISGFAWMFVGVLIVLGIV